MPTERFFNLSEEKRKRIMRAALDEFSRVRYDEISINKIVHAAEIPRGSFYQYFADKQDLLQYLLQDYLLLIERQIGEGLARTGGDVFQVAREILSGIVGYGMREENYAFCHNVFSQIRVGSDESINVAVFAGRKMAEQFYDQIDFSRFRRRGRQETREALELLMMLLGSTLAMAFMDIDRAEEMIAQFERKLAMLQQGILY